MEKTDTFMGEIVMYLDEIVVLMTKYINVNYQCTFYGKN